MIIEIKNLKKSYLEKNVLNIDYLGINKGEKVAITGANDSGKSTLLKLLLDLIKANDGCVLLYGNNVSNNEKWKAKTAAFLDDLFLLNFLTVQEYLYFLSNSTSVAQINELLKTLDFTSLNLNDYIKNLSSGNKKKVGVLGTLLTKKDLLIFDEICNFLGFKSQKGVLNYFKSLSSTIIIVEHNPEFICQFASRLLVLKNGLIAHDVKLSNPCTQNIEKLIAS